MKTATKTSDSLTSKIKETSEEITKKSQDLQKLKADLENFVNANINLNVPVCQEISNSNLNPGELLLEIEKLQELESVRLAKLANVKKASELFRIQIKSAEDDLEQLERQLQILEDEQDWQVNYLPKADKYSATFISEARVKKVKKVADSLQQISNYQSNLEKIQYFLGNPDSEQYLKFCKISTHQSLNYGEAERALNTIPTHIDDLERSIESYTDYFENWLETLTDQPEYRSYIRARIDIENAAKKLSNASQVYLDALADFKALETQCKPCIRFAKDSGYSVNRLRSIVIGDYIEITDVLI